MLLDPRTIEIQPEGVHGHSPVVRHSFVHLLELGRLFDLDDELVRVRKANGNGVFRLFDLRKWA